jgi:peptidoglycan/LPS O-acetylase OafA/YrhL
MRAATKFEPTSVRFADSSASLLFDLVRGIAALIVALEHWRNIFFVDYQQLPAHRAILAIPYLVSAAGHQAVIVFFPLSGFLIGGSVLNAVQRGNWQWGDYLLRRMVRLWLVLIPALVLCACWDLLGLHLGRAPLLYSGGVGNHMIGNVAHNLSPHVFLSNLFFLQEIFTTTFGSDGALWSLAYEFWYYILFPLGFFAIRPTTRPAARAVCIVLCLATAFLVHGWILAYFPIWLGGVLLYWVRPPSFHGRKGVMIRTAVFAVYLPIFFGIAKVQVLPHVLSDYILAVATFGMLWVLRSAKEVVQPGMSARATRGLARFSFTLYAGHMPFLVLLASLVVGDVRWVPTLPHFLMALGPMAAILIFAYLLAYCTEFQTDKIRVRLERMFGLHVTKPELPSDPAAVLGTRGGDRKFQYPLVPLAQAQLKPARIRRRRTAQFR